MSAPHCSRPHSGYRGVDHPSLPDADSTSVKTLHAQQCQQSKTDKPDGLDIKLAD